MRNVSRSQIHTPTLLTGRGKLQLHMRNVSRSQIHTPTLLTGRVRESNLSCFHPLNSPHDPDQP
uniref:Uncharacterized protein n=1 Tax=Anguilla anguilla TaxID=7936 RepID=A0A0E9WGW8_ANGAN